METEWAAWIQQRTDLCFVEIRVSATELVFEADDAQFALSFSESRGAQPTWVFKALDEKRLDSAKVSWLEAVNCEFAL